MGHKVHPYGFRLGGSRTWTAKWQADKEYTAPLQEDIATRHPISRRLAGLSFRTMVRGIVAYAVTARTARTGQMLA